jgi:Capsule polysaccharide biosynthesis protein
MSRILTFSPYQLWKIHTIYEGTIAKACQTRGATVEYLLCDGLPECDQHWDSKANSARPLDICQRCQAAAKTNLVELDFPYRWLGDFVSQPEKAAAFAWAQSVAPAELREASFKDIPIGKWVLSSVISYFRQYPPDLNNSHVVNVYRGFLSSAAIVATGLWNYLDRNAIDAALLFNGRQSITRVAFEIFQQRGIRVLTHERAEYQRGHLNVKPDAHCMNLQPFKAFWSMWSEVPLKREALDATLKWLVQRRYGANLAWIPFNTSFVRDSTLRTRLNLSQDKRLWVLFTSSTDEIAGDPLWQGPYESQAEWVREVVRWVTLRDDVELVIKVHPNLGGNSYIGKAVDELRVYQEMKAALPASIRIVLPEDSVNTYSLADESDVGLTFGSTIGLEMAMLGKPVLLASRALYEYGSKTLTVHSKDSLPGMLEKCLHASTDKEIQREAFRLAYYYMFRFELPFPAVSVSGLYEAKPNYVHREDLAPGKDDSLDHICNFLTEGRPLFDGPAAEDRSRSTAEEDRFFEELAHAPDHLRNVRYERWIRLQSLGRSTRDSLRRLPLGVGHALLNLGRRRWHAFLTWVETGDGGRGN